MNPVRVTVIIVNWNGGALLHRAVESSLSQDVFGQRPEVIVFDNCSTDSSAEAAAEAFPSVDVVFSDENLGFGRGNNEAFRRADTEYCVFLNPDAEFLEPDAIEALLSTLQDPKIGIVGPRLLNSDGTLQQSCSSVPNVANSVANVLGVGRLFSDELRRRWFPVLWSHGVSSITGWVGGACIAMRSADFASIGGFSERTFMYGEDLELGHRIRMFGMSVFYRHDVAVVHHGDASSKQRWSDAETASRTALGELAFFRQRYGGFGSEFLRAIYVAGYGGRALVFRVLGRSAKARTYASMARALAGATRELGNGGARSGL